MKRRAIAIVATFAVVGAGSVIALVHTIREDARRIVELQAELEKEYEAATEKVRSRQHAKQQDSPMKRTHEILDDLDRRLERRRKLRLSVTASIESRNTIAADLACYDDWLEADRKVRLAKVKNDQGDLVTAKRLLLEASTSKSLGPDALASIEKRLRDWGLADAKAR